MCLKKAASYGYDATTLAWDWSDALTYRARSFRPDAQLAHQRAPLRLLLADVAGLPVRRAGERLPPPLPAPAPAHPPARRPRPRPARPSALRSWALRRPTMARLVPAGATMP